MVKGKYCSVTFMEDETECGAQERKSGNCEIEATPSERKWTETQCEIGQAFSVMEGFGEDSPTMKEETGENWFCYATDLLNTSSSANVSGTDLTPHDKLRSHEEKWMMLEVHAADGAVFSFFVVGRDVVMPMMILLRNDCLVFGTQSPSFPYRISAWCAARNFRSKHQLQRHFYDYHLDERLECGECGRKFGSIVGLKKHKQVMHRNHLHMRSYESPNHPDEYSQETPHEGKLTEPQSEPGQALIVEEAGEDSFTVKAESGENLVCVTGDLLEASSSVDLSGDDMLPHDNVPFDEEKVPNQCMVCGKQFAFKHQLQRHFYDYHLDERLECGECGRKFGSIAGLKKHKQVMHRDHLHMRSYEDPDHPGYEYSQEIPHEGKLTEPQSEPRQALIVEEADEDLFTVKEETGENLICVVADSLDASSSVDVIGDRMSPHDNLPLDTEKVPEVLHAADVNLVKTDNKPVVERPRQCVKCGERFAFKCQLQRHFYNHHFDERLTCGECGRKFGSVSGLNLHKHVVHRNRIFMCMYEGCDHPGFKSRKALTEHICSVHTNVRPYVCETCGKAFVSASHLRRHTFTHSSESAFQCKCGVKFRHKISLNRHQRLCRVL
ncbi:hypothetical protein KIN20_015651 [Parelaphostrongylus tenuis]|uniref:C2H2-type domain-containing protein n=1 Tax=Parelaphostrongylus tenuis TaxID=148309 RepID=A0AAD5QQ23_PARTN|nr:hypothetical protein KIN20_015651 [Parelaphostrongylus tenuis]